MAAQKNIYKPTYLESGGVHTHFPVPKAGFDMYVHYQSQTSA